MPLNIVIVIVIVIELVVFLLKPPIEVAGRFVSVCAAIFDLAVSIALAIVVAVAAIEIVAVV